MLFTERTPIEKGFAEVFERRIQPELDGLEEERKAFLKKGLTRFIGITVLGIVGGMAIAMAMDLPWFAGLIVAGVVAFVGYSFKQSQAAKWSGTVAETVMPHVTRFLGNMSYSRGANRAFDVQRVVDLGLIGSYDSSVLEDHITGTWNGMEFELLEADLTERSGDNDRTTVFKGLIFRVSLPEPTPTPILIARNYGAALNKLAGMFSGSKGRGMPKVETHHPRFEADFELHAMDGDAARAYLPPAFLDNLTAIGAEEGKRGTKSMRAAFSGSDFWLTLERNRPFMELASLYTPIHDIEDQLHAAFEDFDTIRRIIDRLRA